MGCGCPVISTRIPHAAEVLDDGTGVLIDFQRPDQLAQATVDLLMDPVRSRYRDGSLPRGVLAAGPSIDFIRAHPKYVAKVHGLSLIHI